MRQSQVFLKENVLQTTKKRTEFIFDNFENIIVSISGGKDSTVLAHWMLCEARKRNRKIGIFFLDEETVYQSTVEQIEHIYEGEFAEWIIPLWLQIEYNSTNATSYSERYIITWEAGKHKVWMRPKKSYAIKFPPWDIKEQIILNKKIGLDFYAVIKNFENCYSDTAFIVGLRGTESMNRWRTVSKNPVSINGQTVYWATQKEKNVALYPLYDWNYTDVWRYIYENKLKYNKVYDWQFKLGFGINEMRISSLIHERAFKSLVELPEFEPKTYERLIKRVKGIEFAQETGKKAKMMRVRKLPKNYSSWLEYKDFLLETYPNESEKEIFKNRFEKHLRNEYVARQQCRQLILADVENNLPVDNKPDPRQELIDYYMRVL